MISENTRPIFLKEYYFADCWRWKIDFFTVKPFRAFYRRLAV